MSKSSQKAVPPLLRVVMCEKLPAYWRGLLELRTSFWRLSTQPHQHAVKGEGSKVGWVRVYQRQSPSGLPGPFPYHSDLDDGCQRKKRVGNQIKGEADVPIVQRFAQVFGAVYVLVGVAGFVPPLLVGSVPPGSWDPSPGSCSPCSPSTGFTTWRT